MINEDVKVNRTLHQLGLPPMELAESSNDQNSRCLYRCMYPALQKVIILLILLTFIVGAYILLLKLLGSADSSSNTEIILVTGVKDNSNITVRQADLDIFFLIKNFTYPSTKRKKRHVLDPYDTYKETVTHLEHKDVDKIREIVLKHRKFCHDGKHESDCIELVAELRSILEQKDGIVTENLEEPIKIDGGKPLKIVSVKPNLVDVAKREVHPITRFRSILEPAHVVPINNFPIHRIPQPHAGLPEALPITDTCLLATLLGRNCPQVQELHYPPSVFVPPDSHSDVPHNMRYFQPTQLHGRETETQRRKLHPQDVDIFMSFLTQKPDMVTKQEFNASRRATECLPGLLPCDSMDNCLDESQWCDGTVDCLDASDEIRCSCKSRVDKSRLCDGYFDCPFGEDEMGCFGCSATTFSCENLDSNLEGTCFNKEQRCNNVVDCPNHKDEIECNMLSPSLHKNPLFAISNSEGYLHRNFKGDWYAACQNPYMWAHDACRRETGLMIRPPFIEIVPIDPLLKVNYLNTEHGGLIQSSETCFNSSAVYVVCPDFLCGTRAQSNSQLLRENIASENLLYGRNKRFLLPHRFDKYSMMYFGSRMKREVSSSDELPNDERNKRAESRVVGGKPSQPAAWPWMVAIYRDGMFHCGGVIFSQSWIISAAHCVHKFWDHYYEVQVGMLRRFSFSPQEQNHRVTHIIVNQHYSQIDMKDDLSLLKVDTLIQFSRWARPICLPGHNTAGQDWLWGPIPGTVCTAVGWGATMEHGPDPDHMREVEVPIWERCKHREDRAGKEICAGLAEGGKDACQGDSGGPLLCKNPLNSQQWYLAGIVSHGDGCARKGEPGVYTRVSLFVKWIKYHTSSKTLPLVQPLQECPGFKCVSGISKCLPKSRKCDKVVDCLDTEDEINCHSMQSSDFTSRSFHNAEVSKTPEKSSTDVLVKPGAMPSTENILTKDNILKEQSTSSSNETTQILTEIIVPTSTIKSIENNHSEQSVTIESISSVDEVPDFSHASTLEISITNSSEEQTNDDENENVTADPKSSTSYESGDTHHDDIQSITIAIEPQTLESRSSVLEENNPNKPNTRKTDIDEDWTITDSTTSIISTNSDDQFSDSSTQKTFLEVNSELNPENKSLDNAAVETIIDTRNLSESKNKNEKLIIELLPTNFPLTTEKAITSLEDITSIDTTLRFVTSTESVQAKNLPDVESKSNNLQKIEDIVFSEFQPASIRRKHRIPKEFVCRRISQQIPYNQRCDHNADCEDGTDELGCDCTDYLSVYDQKLICDGVFDCADGQDELDCYTCPEDHFLCKRSEVCVPTKYICDGKPQCPLGEDELNCFALSNGREIFYEIDDKPKINFEGYLTKRNKDNWQVLCENKLSIEQQELSATHVCHYLGFSSANRYNIKHINVKDEDISYGLDEIKRIKRNTGKSIPVHFSFRDVHEIGGAARNIVINEPQVLKEECVPNITKTCESLYVYCDHALYTNFEVPQNLLYNRDAGVNNEVTTHMWPWIAKVYVEGEYKCTGVLVNVTWVLVSDSCLWDSSPGRNFVTVVLGSHRTLDSVNGLYEMVHKVDAKKDLFRSRVILLHLKKPVEYSNMVKPMIVSPPMYHSEQKAICVAVGQDNNNNTISVFLNETNNNCNLSNRCFIRNAVEKICSGPMNPHRKWSGIISCHNEQGWHPAASFVDSRGECELGDRIVATDIENLRQEIKYHAGKVLSSESIEHTDDHCEGIRCSRGRCVTLKHLCDGVRNCEDGNDESESSCKIKRLVCDEDPYHRGCECSLGQMKCKNGKCIPKELFRDGNDDCGDGTDEPMRISCSDYLARVMPSRLCDGILHCEDRSDEDPMFCKCFAKRNFRCSKSDDVEHCVAPDMVCDGIRDCSNGYDEKTCIGLSAPEGTPYGTGQVIVRSHGVWHSKCYPTQTHTKSELEAICRELGFISGHAKEIKDVEKYLVNSHNNLKLEQFNDVVLNNQTVIKMRNADGPVAQAVLDEELQNCFPVFIECL